MTAETFIHDRAYQERLSGVLLDAMLLGLKDEATNTVVIRSGDVFEVLTRMQAMVIATSSPVSSPTKCREFCQGHAKRLQRMILQYQALYERDGPPFETMTIEGELH